MAWKSAQLKQNPWLRGGAWLRDPEMLQIPQVVTSTSPSSYLWNWKPMWKLAGRLGTPAIETHFPIFYTSASLANSHSWPWKNKEARKTMQVHSEGYKAGRERRAKRSKKTKRRHQPLTPACILLWFWARLHGRETTRENSERTMRLKDQKPGQVNIVFLWPDSTVI